MFNNNGLDILQKKVAWKTLTNFTNKPSEQSFFQEISKKNKEYFINVLIQELINQYLHQQQQHTIPLSYVKKDHLIGVLQHTTVKLFRKISEILKGSACIRVLFQKGSKVMAYQCLEIRVNFPLYILIWNISEQLTIHLQPSSNH